MPKRVAQNRLFSRSQGKGAIGFVDAIRIAEVIGILDLNNRVVWLSAGCRCYFKSSEYIIECLLSNHTRSSYNLILRG